MSRAVTLIDVLNHADARERLESIEDMLASWNGRDRYADEIQWCIDEIERLTGYRYELD